MLLKLPIEPVPYEQRLIIQHLTPEKPFGEPHKVEKLKQFSPHWLRHLSASMQNRAGVKFTHIRDNLRHSKDDTTRIYVHAENEERIDSISQLKLVPEVKFSYIRDNLRHSKNDTTRIYVHAEDEERVDSISQLKLEPEQRLKRLDNDIT